MTSMFPDPDEVDPDERALQRIATALTQYTWDKPWKSPFLAAFAITGNVSEAARRVGISREHATMQRHADTQFDAAWVEAQEIGADRLEEIAWRRATTGEPKRTVRTKYDEQGTVIETVIEETLVISNAMLITLMKATRPEKYRERFEHRVTGHDGGPVQVEVDRRPTHERMVALLKLAQELEIPDELPVIDAAPSDHSANGDGSGGAP